MKLLKRVLVAVFVVLIPIQDFGLRNTGFGILGASVSVIPLLGIVCLTALQWAFKPQWRLPRVVIWLAAYATVINVIGLIRFGTEALGISLVAKTFTLSVLTVLWLFVVFGIDYLQIPRFGALLKIAFSLVIAGIVLGDLHAAGLGFLVNNPLLHGTLNNDERWRGLTAEASQLSTLSIGVGLLSAQYAKNRVTQMGIAAVALLIMVNSASKGGILTLGLTLLILALTARVPARKVLAGGILMVPVLYLASLKLQTMSSAELVQQTTTVATRSTAAVWGLRTVLFNPQGVGFGGFYAELARYIPTAMDVVYRHAEIPLNFSEVETYAVSAENATSKIFFLNLAVTLGLPFLAWFAAEMWGHLRRLNVRRHLFLLTAFWYVVVAMCSYVDAPTSYSSFLVFGVVVSESRKLRNAAGCE